MAYFIVRKFILLWKFPRRNGIEHFKWIILAKKTIPFTTSKKRVTSSQEGGMGRHTASLHNQKTDNKFKNKKQPELSEN